MKKRAKCPQRCTHYTPDSLPSVRKGVHPAAKCPQGWTLGRPGVRRGVRSTAKCPQGCTLGRPSVRRGVHPPAKCPQGCTLANGQTFIKAHSGLSGVRRGVPYFISFTYRTNYIVTYTPTDTSAPRVKYRIQKPPDTSHRQEHTSPNPER